MPRAPHLGRGVLERPALLPHGNEHNLGLAPQPVRGELQRRAAAAHGGQHQRAVVLPRGRRVEERVAGLLHRGVHHFEVVLHLGRQMLQEHAVLLHGGEGLLPRVAWGVGRGDVLVGGHAAATARHGAAAKNQTGSLLQRWG